MMIGALLAILASILTYVLARTVLTELAQYGEKLEAIVGLIAIAVLLFVLNWFFHKVYWTDHIKKFNKRRRRLLAVAGGGLISAQVLGFVLLGFSTVYREGFETVLFLQALELNSGLVVVVEGVALGAIAVGAVAVATFKLERKLPYRKMLIVTGILLTAVLAILVGKTVRTMQGVGWVPITPIDIELPYWTGIWLGIFPTVETVVAQIASVVFVIASYFAAERLKHRPKGRSAAGLRPAAHGPDDAAQAYTPDAGNAAGAVDTADAGHARGAPAVPDAGGNGSAAYHANAAHNGRAANHAGANGNAGAADHPGTADGPGAADDPRARDDARAPDDARTRAAAGAAHHS